MAFDKVIDSVKLDTALLATAEVIRNKSGLDDPINWDENSGFASAIENDIFDNKSLIERTITEYNNYSEIQIGDYAFHKCYDLTSVNIPNATRIKRSAFSYCEIMTSINCPKITKMADYSFAGCINLNSISPLPLLELLEQGAFQQCSSLKQLDVTNVANIQQDVFKDCASLATLIFRKEDGICNLSNVNAFTGTPFTTSIGTVYVPQNLISTYQEATNWSTLYTAGTCIFKPLSELE